MIYFLLLLVFILQVVNLCLIISVLKTNDDVLNFCFDHHRELDRIEKILRRKL